MQFLVDKDQMVLMLESIIETQGIEGKDMLLSENWDKRSVVDQAEKMLDNLEIFSGSGKVLLSEEEATFIKDFYS